MTEKKEMPIPWRFVNLALIFILCYKIMVYIKVPGAWTNQAEIFPAMWK
jgi:hypothetical protein